MDSFPTQGSIYIHNISQLVTCAGSPRRGAEQMNDIGAIQGPCALLIRDGIIEFAGKETALDPKSIEGIPQLDAEGKCALPGFVDSHTHLVFGGYREEEFQWRLAGQSYMEIMQKGGGIASTMKATREASEEELLESASKHLQNMLLQGVTSCEAKSGYGMDEQTELRQLRVIRKLQGTQPVEVTPTYMGAHDIPPEYKDDPDGYISFMIDTMLPEIKEQGLAQLCDIFTEEGVFTPHQTTRLLSAAKEMGFGIKMHADEIVSYGGAELAASLGCVSADHLLKISDAGIQALASSDTVATLLPLTAFSLQDEYAPARKLIDAGCMVALASDLNPGSCFSSSIPLLIALATIYMHMTMEETISALTINGAKAIGREDSIGSLEVGKQGDVILIDFPSYKFLSYHFGMNLVKSVVKRGHIFQSRITRSIN